MLVGDVADDAQVEVPELVGVEREDGVEAGLDQGVGLAGHQGALAVLAQLHRLDLDPGVAAGDLVLVLEAMKMEQPVYAHRDGVIANLAAEAGATLSSGVSICEIVSENDR